MRRHIYIFISQDPDAELPSSASLCALVLSLRHSGKIENLKPWKKSNMTSTPSHVPPNVSFPVSHFQLGKKASLLIIRVPSQNVVTYQSPVFICFQLPHWIKAGSGGMGGRVVGEMDGGREGEMSRG